MHRCYAQNRPSKAKHAVDFQMSMRAAFTCIKRNIWRLVTKPFLTDPQAILLLSHFSHAQGYVRYFNLTVYSMISERTVKVRIP